jgi:hypothetical protein
MNGGIGLANGQGTANATDLKLASTNAATTGSGTSSQVVGATKATSTAAGILSTLVTGTGAQTNATLYGSAGQGNWANVNGDALNFSSANNGTNGFFSGTDAAVAPITVNGTAKGDGNSEVTVTGVGTNNAGSTDKTTGTATGSTSLTTTDPKPTTTLMSGVSGGANVNAQSFVGNPNNGTPNAGAWNSGSGSFYGTSPTASLTGQITSNGANNAVISATGATASAVNSTTASVKP